VLLVIALVVPRFPAIERPAIDSPRDSPVELVAGPGDALARSSNVCGCEGQEKRDDPVRHRHGRLRVAGSGVLVGCEKGPAEKVGEKLDNALDKLSGKGPLEKAGEHIDKAVNKLTKK
jgi:hypothetical protein